MNLFDLRGPDFLAIYAVFLSIAIAFGVFWRRICLNRSSKVDSSSVPLDPFELAYLSGGAKRLAQAALASLVHRGIIEFGMLGKLKIAGDRNVSLNWCERAVVDDVGRRLFPSMSKLPSSVNCEPIRHKLEREGMVVSASSRFFAGLLPVLLTALVLLIGLIKFEIGLSRDRPVGYLALLCVFTFIVLIMQTNVRLLTTRGEAVLQKLRDANSTLQTAAKGDTRTLSCSDVVLAFALWGPAMLSGAKFAKMRATLLSQQSSGTTFGIAGCGGSSCGGGGCGGGGGGGGCGGCGS